MFSLFAPQIPTAVVHRFGWVLIHSLWQLALLAGMAMLCVRWMRRSSADARYGVLVAAMYIMAAAPAVTWLVLTAGAPLAVSTGTSNGVADKPAPPSLESKTVDLTPAATTMSPSTGAGTTDLRMAKDGGHLDDTSPGGSSASLIGAAAVLLQPWLPTIVGAWCLGVLVFSLRPLAGWYTVFQLRRVGVTTAHDVVRKAAARVAQQLGVHKAVRALQSTRVHVPLVVGLVRPVILLPVSLVTALPVAQLDAILAHELAHIRRHDYLINILQTLFETAFFYQPAAWWLSNRIRIERENCCDDLAVAACGNRVAYGRALLAIEELRCETTVLALGARGGSLLDRVQRLAGPNPEPRMRASSAVLPHVVGGPAALAVIAGIAVIMALSMTWVASARHPGQAKEVKGTVSSLASKPEPILAQLPVERDQGKSIRRWRIQVVDAIADKRLPGIKVRVLGARKDEPEPVEMVLTSDENGLVEIPLRSDQNGMGSITVLTPGWWGPTWTRLGDVATGRAETGPPAPALAKPITLPLWRGTYVTGRLLKPDGQPAAGVELNLGVYISNQEWKKRLGMDLTFYSWDHGDWPNWTRSVTTSKEGNFASTVPPPDARSWVRVGTTGLAHAPIHSDRSGRDSPKRAIERFAPFEYEFAGEPVPQSKLEKSSLDFGTLTLKRGTVLRGTVVDAEGKPLAGIGLLTSGRHGPYAGRDTVSGANGAFEFLPMNPGTFTLSPDARIRNDGKVESRDVQAVFVPQIVQLPASDEPVELTVRAVPHVLVEFEWVDRRKEKGPVAYYGAFTVTGRVPRDGSEPVWWRGETERITRDGRDLLVVKVPAAITEPTLHLPADSVVTASYEDDLTKSGPGSVVLQDLAGSHRRVIYGDEPK